MIIGFLMIKNLKNLFRMIFFQMYKKKLNFRIIKIIFKENNNFKIKRLIKIKN